MSYTFKIATMVFVSLVTILSKASGQSDNFSFHGEVGMANYYLLKGEIDGKYPVTMKLYVYNSARCGEEWRAIQWKNGGIDGWYEYDRIGERIDLTGSYRYEGEVKIFVPHSPADTIDKFTCDMENYREVFWNDKDFDVTGMKWKMRGDREAKSVYLRVLHEPEPDTLFLVFKSTDREVKKINVSELIDLERLNDIQVISYSRVEGDFHVLVKLAYNGRREYQEYIGYLRFNDDLDMEHSDIHLGYDSWKGEPEKLIYEERHPEKGIVRQD